MSSTSKYKKREGISTCKHFVIILIKNLLFTPLKLHAVVAISVALCSV